MHGSYMGWSLGRLGHGMRKSRRFELPRRFPASVLPCFRAPPRLPPGVIGIWQLPYMVGVPVWDMVGVGAIVW